MVPSGVRVARFRRAGVLRRDPALQTFYVDRELIVRESIADLRAAGAAHPCDGRLGRMIEQWIVHSDEFARLWYRRDVRVNGRGRKQLSHAVVGRLNVDFEVLMPLPDPHERLEVYRAADAGSQAALDRIRAGLPSAVSRSRGVFGASTARPPARRRRCRRPRARPGSP